MQTKYTLKSLDSAWDRFLGYRTVGTFYSMKSREEIIAMLDQNFPPVRRQGELKKGYQVTFHKQ